MSYSDENFGKFGLIYYGAEMVYLVVITLKQKISICTLKIMLFLCYNPASKMLSKYYFKLC